MAFSCACDLDIIIFRQLWVLIGREKRLMCLLFITTKLMPGNSESFLTRWTINQFIKLKLLKWSRLSCSSCWNHHKTWASWYGWDTEKTLWSLAWREKLFPWMAYDIIGRCCDYRLCRYGQANVSAEYLIISTVF